VVGGTQQCVRPQHLESGNANVRRDKIKIGKSTEVRLWDVQVEDVS
jgi:hypothetical protein